MNLPRLPPVRKWSYGPSPKGDLVPIGYLMYLRERTRQAPMVGRSKVCQLGK
jgi:hypothetical protein